jgi:hypothetical protein
VAEAAKAAPAAEILTRLDETAAACPNAVEVQSAAAALRATLLSAEGGPAALPALWEKHREAGIGSVGAGVVGE